ncbi:MAG: hypothetical protein SAqTSB_36370 [Shewanella algae]
MIFNTFKSTFAKSVPNKVFKMDALYSLSVDEGAVLELLNGKESAEITYTDLLEADRDSIRRRLSSAEFQMSLMRSSEVRLKEKVLKLNSEISEYRLDLEEANERNAILTSELEALSTSSPSIDGLISIDELTQLKREYEKLNADLSGKVRLLENEKSELTQTLNEQRANVDALRETVSELESKLEIDANKLLASEGRISELKTAHARELREAHKGQESLRARLDSKEAENKRLEAKNAENKRRLLDAKNTMLKANQHLTDFGVELDKTRTERRYLGFMLQAMIHEDFFECDAGGASVFSFQTDITSTEGEFEIDPRYPIALWLGKNGFAVVMGIGRDGNLIMPTIPGISDELLEELCPPRAVHGELAEKLKEFDVEACNRAMANTRHRLSQMSVDLAHNENLIQSNKNLIAISSKHRAMARAGGKVNRKKRNK